MRLGDLDALKVFLKEYWQWLDDGEYAEGFFDAIELIEKAPTIDAVQVCRCKDCKWGKTWKNGLGVEGFKCDILCVDLSPEAFCSYGERKEADGNG